MRLGEIWTTRISYEIRGWNFLKKRIMLKHHTHVSTILASKLVDLFGIIKAIPKLDHSFCKL